jgi:hypothetical protein
LEFVKSKDDVVLDGSMKHALQENSKVGQVNFISMVNKSSMPTFWVLDKNKSISVSEVTHGSVVFLAFHLGVYDVKGNCGFNIVAKSYYIESDGSVFLETSNPLADPQLAFNAAAQNVVQGQKL